MGWGRAKNNCIARSILFNLASKLFGFLMSKVGDEGGKIEPRSQGGNKKLFAMDEKQKRKEERVSFAGGGDEDSGKAGNRVAWLLENSGGGRWVKGPSQKKNGRKEGGGCKRGNTGEGQKGASFHASAWDC